MNKNLINEPQRVLVFNSLKRLVATFSSVNATAQAFGVSPSNISLVCRGKAISCKGFYFRSLNGVLAIVDGDYGNLTLSDYDNKCDINRESYPNKKMNREGMHYKTKKRGRPKKQL